MAVTPCFQTASLKVSYNSELFTLTFRFLASDHQRPYHSSRQHYNPRPSNYNRPGQYNQHGGEYHGYDKNEKYMPRFDKQKQREWEEIIDSTPTMYKNAKFFIMKSQDETSVLISQKESVWSTTFGPTKKLTDAYKNPQNQNVVLIFSINESGGYQGYCLMKGTPNQALKPHIFKRNNYT